MARFSWDLAPLGTVPLGAVEKRALSLAPNGERLATTDWNTCDVVLADATTGTRIAGNGEGIPSGASLSPDGHWMIAGSADQGSGAILLFDVTKARGDALPMEKLPEANRSPGLDDAPYFSVFSSDSARAAVSCESWGGRGVFVFDVATKAPVWSLVLPGTNEEPEEWFPHAVAFADQDRLLLVSNPGSIRAYRASDGADLGDLSTEDNGQDGFVVDEARRCIWMLGEVPVAHPFPKAWSTEPKSAAPKAAETATTGASKKPTPKKTTLKKTTPKKPAPKKTTPKKPAPKKPAPKKTTPKKATPKKPTPKKPVPKKATPKKATPKKTLKKPTPKKGAPQKKSAQKAAAKKASPKKPTAKKRRP